jgi:predicted AlkP superfamily pyrophosphatase or phosphodiesterase
MDGLSEREMVAASQLPGFRKLLERGTCFGTLRGIYPTLTYVAHATLMTGRFPEDHGILHNHPLQPGIPSLQQRWYWYASDVRAPTLFDLAREQGLSTAAVLWPLSAGGRITWNFPEISALPGENQTLKVLHTGSPGFLLSLERKFRKFRKGRQQPYLDDYVSRCAAYTIRSRKPHLLMTHFISLDEAKHQSGSESSETREALLVMDTGLGRILEAIEESGAQDTTTIVVVGDHGHIDIVRRVRLNKLLETAGLCGRVDEEFQWRAWFQCAGGSAFLHIRKGDQAATSKAREVLDAARLDPEIGIKNIHEGRDLAALRCGTAASFAVDARSGVQFVEDIDGQLIEPAPALGAFGADHGYHPDMPEYRSLFLAAGPGIAQGSTPEETSLEDVACTCARALGLLFPPGNGIRIPVSKHVRKAAYA